MYNIYCDTAEIAGEDKRVREWTRAKESTVKLEVLVRLYGALWDLGASSALDERLAGDRTRRHSSGLSSKVEVQKKLSE